MIRLFKDWFGSLGFLLAMAGMMPHALGGDILRGGAGGGSGGARRSSDSRSNSGAAAAQAARVRAQDQLARTTKTVNDMRALQAAARAAAGANTIPNGLGAGGLDLDRIVRGASDPTQAGNTVTIRQNESQAMLEWKSFNVGRDTTLNFDQSAGGVDSGKWIAFNKVIDPLAKPSEIRGKINAQGQVYIINRNGIVFGSGSQVNTRSLVASTLPINETLIQRGLLNQEDKNARFLFDHTLDESDSAAGFGDIVVERGAELKASTTAEKVGGRVILAGSNVRNAGNISTPDGQTILAAGSQVGLAAHPSTDPTLRGLDVYIGEVLDTAGVVENTGLIESTRGSVSMAGKSVRQYGVVESSTSTALNGRVDLLANYDAVPNADYSSSDTTQPLFHHNASGLIDLGPGSLIRILPELDGTDRAVGTRLALASMANLQGRAIHFQSQATIHAPGASTPNGSIAQDGSRQPGEGILKSGINIRAGAWSGTKGLATKWAAIGGQVYFDEGASINVAGTVDVAIPITHDLLTLQLRGAELANSPLQRKGAIRGADITVDARRKGVWNGQSWVGTPLGDVSGYLGIIQKSVGELTTAGGTVGISAGESVVMQPGSIIDVSGGTIHHAAGTIRTTRLLSRGRLVDIADATPDRVYDSIYTGETTTTHAKWGIGKTYRSALAPLGEYFQNSYVEGADAGTISINAPSMALDGSLTGHAVQGPRQVNERTFSAAARGTLQLRFQAANPVTPQFNISPTPPQIFFATQKTNPTAGAFAWNETDGASPLGEDRKNQFAISPDLFGNGGFGSILIDNSEGHITIPSGNPIAMPLRGSLTLRAANLSIDSAITAPGGTLDFTTFNISPFFAAQSQSATIKPPTPEPDPSRGIFSLGAFGKLSTAGLLADNRPGLSTNKNLPPVIDGGSVSINAYSGNLAPGSLVDVSGGLSIRSDGKSTYGNGGSILVSAGRDPSLNWVLGGTLQLGGDLRGFSRLKGGSLALQAPMVRIGGSTTPPSGVTDGELLQIDPGFFSKGGFNSFTITGLGKALDAASGRFLPAISIEPGTQIHPVVESRVAKRIGGVETLQPIVLPEGIRSPVNLSFIAPVTKDIWATPSVNTLRGDIVVGEGARIESDPMAKIALKGGTVSILGDIIAPGGQINISGDSTYPIYKPSDPGADEKNARPTVFLGPNSIISTAGKFVQVPDIFASRLGAQRRLGTVLPGGRIAVQGNIVAAQGAVLDVSGASAIVDVHPSLLIKNSASGIPHRSDSTSGLTKKPYALESIATKVDSDGGTLSLTGSEMLFTDATLRGFAGGPSASGGALEISSGRYNDPSNPLPSSPLDINLQVTQSGNWIPSNFNSDGGSAVGELVPVDAGDRGHFSVSRFLAGGFDSLKLSGSASGAVGFDGEVSISARRQLSVAEGGVLAANGNVLLEAPHVILGTAFQPPVQSGTSDTDRLSLPGKAYVMPSSGSGVLTVRASLIDIGNLSLQNIGLANFIAENGDIRGNGALNIAGTLNLRAGQIYPTTAGLFNIVAYDLPEAPGSGRIEISGSGTRPVPYSAGGTLGVYASTIMQGGTLRAPFGTIYLGWDGTGPSPKDYLSGAGLNVEQSLPVAKEITLAAGSLTSVSAQGVTIPYGYNSTPETWINPAGIDITGTGLPDKGVFVSGLSVSSLSGSTIDVAGVGNMLSHRWVAGNGGTIDILAESSGAFAILPGYGFDYSPYTTFNGAAADPGYNDSRLVAGDKIHLGGGSILPAGDYTLLPARYALLPGAVLVTPKSSSQLFGYSQNDGSMIVAGYRYNSQSSSTSRPLLSTRFEVAPPSVFRQRAEYETYFANTFFPAAAARLDLNPQKAPMDSGRVSVSGLNALNFNGFIRGKSLSGGSGAEIDLSTTANIIIGNKDSIASPGTTVLDAANLSSFGADSLLIGGIRHQESAGTRVSVSTKSLKIDNAGSPLLGSEILLVASENLEIAPGSSILQSGATRSGSLKNSTPLLLGNANEAGSGNGLLVRLSDHDAPIRRSAVMSQSAQSALDNPPTLIVGAESTLSGGHITLDSTYDLKWDPSATLLGGGFSISAGQIAIVSDNAGDIPAIAGLTLSGEALKNLSNSDKLSLQSYSSLDFYESGRFGTRGSLDLNASQFRGFNTAGETLSIAAQVINIGNTYDAASLDTPSESSGRLSFSSEIFHLGKGALQIGGFSAVEIQAPSGFQAEGSGSLDVLGSLSISTPAVTALKAKYSITAENEIALNSLGTASKLDPGLGSSLSLTSGSGLSVNTNIILPSGSISLRAISGDLVIGSDSSTSTLLDTSGTKKTFQDISRYTNGGTVHLASDSGNIELAAGSRINVSANAGGGNAGSIEISVPTGGFTFEGAMIGSAGSGGDGGSFSLDTASLASPSPIDALLNAESFTGQRAYRVRKGDVSVNGLATAKKYRLSADQGSITITESGFIDAYGPLGGEIRLSASGSIALKRRSKLSVAAQDFNAAGKGGKITLEAGSSIDGSENPDAFLDIAAGSTLDLSVLSPSDDSASLGHFSGTLHLRAPQNSWNISSLAGSILGASSIVAEGFRVFDLTDSGLITDTVQEDVRAAGEAFAANIPDIALRLDRSDLESSLVVLPGVEIINTTGSLTLGDTSSGGLPDWDLSTFRFGEKLVPGILTLRAKGDVVFLGALSDGFETSDNQAALLPASSTLPENTQSWSYRIVAGSDFSAADFAKTTAAEPGSIQIGNPTPEGVKSQFIRTGTGDIEMAASGNIQLLNQFATVYTAGIKVDGDELTMNGRFSVPGESSNSPGDNPYELPDNFNYPAQYARSGGSISLQATGNIERLALNADGELVPDSQKQFPNNWLYRRGAVDDSGAFAETLDGEIASTTWWVDFSNFFQGVGALSGGMVSLEAGSNISNVDAVVTTNARTSYTTLDGNRDAANQQTIELGGGDLSVKAGRNIDAGMYYVERGRGHLEAGGEITTNPTRIGYADIGFGSEDVDMTLADAGDYSQALPTTLFLGKGSFNVQAGGDINLGPTLNPFLLPTGLNNSVRRKSYFSTYAPDSSVSVTSTGGSVTLRNSSSAFGTPTADPIMKNWMEPIHLQGLISSEALSLTQPWLGLGEGASTLNDFERAFTLLPGILKVSALSGDVNLVGRFDLWPSASGTLEVGAGGNLIGMSKLGIILALGDVPQSQVWATSTVNLSDADPASLPTTKNPFGLTNSIQTDPGFLDAKLTKFFNESGSSTGLNAVIQTQQALHGRSILHAEDKEPIRLLAGSGDISGLTLFASKRASIQSGRDIEDVAFHIQNTDSRDLTLVSAGRDIVPFNANTPFRVSSRLAGNILAETGALYGKEALSGDIQINGQGTIAVLAGRNLDLGLGPNNADGTGAGLTSIGNARNPNLSFQGANIIAAAGIGSTSPFADTLRFESFIQKFVKGENGAAWLAEVSSRSPNLPNLTPSTFDALDADTKARVALEVFYLVLRDSGRAKSDSTDSKSTPYADGFEAINLVFGSQSGSGDILTRSRDIRTRSGGSISLLAPSGSLELATSTIGSPLTPPGIVTEAGGPISIFTDGDVNIGISRIFTLRGGDQIIWSSTGDIAAGSSSKTVQSAPPTRVLIDPQSAALNVDLGGLATGGGIGVLASVEGVEPGNVDLIAPGGTVDAGDAGIRSTGNLNIAATKVLNADNISTGGSSTGVPTAPVVAAPNIGGLTSGSNAAAAANAAAQGVANQSRPSANSLPEAPSIISVEILGYGGGEGDSDEG